jgi:hypothetical protein
LSLIKYQSDGVFLWHTYLFTDTVDGNDVAVDSSGNVYFTFVKGQVAVEIYHGTGVLAVNLTGSDNELALVKFNSAGTYQWSARLDSEGTNAMDLGGRLGVDSSGNIYLGSVHQADTTFKTSIRQGSGALFGTNYTNTGRSCLTTKFNSAGAVQWVREFSPCNHANGKRLPIDSEGSMYITSDAAITSMQLFQFDNSVAFELTRYTGMATLSFILKMSTNGTLPCGAGRYYTNAVSACVVCPSNFYRSASDPVTSYPCLTCPASTTTATFGSTLLSDCTSGTKGGPLVCSDASDLPCTGLKFKHPTLGTYWQYDAATNQTIVGASPSIYDLVSSGTLYNGGQNRYAIKNRGTNRHILWQGVCCFWTLRETTNFDSGIAYAWYVTQAQKGTVNIKNDWPATSTMPVFTGVNANIVLILTETDTRIVSWQIERVCPFGSTYTAGAVCTCMAGYYGNGATQCYPCPSESSCSGGTNVPVACSAGTTTNGFPAQSSCSTISPNSTSLEFRFTVRFTFNVIDIDIARLIMLLRCLLTGSATAIPRWIMEKAVFSAPAW